MVTGIRKYFPLIFLFCAVIFFYGPFLLTIFDENPKLPVPTDTIVGLYHPFRDFYADNYPNGIPFKNFLTTDPVRQTYIWKELATHILQGGDFPTWNPYEMAGKPLFANFQSGVLYPLNLLLAFPRFEIMWSIMIMLQSVLTALFTFLFLRNLKVDISSSVIGAAAFTFSGFSISWLQWGTIGHTALWLPLILFCIDKIVFSKGKLLAVPSVHNRRLNWHIVFFIALISGFFAGHLQTFFYLYFVSLSYFAIRFFQNRSKALFVSFAVVNLLFVVASSIQWVPTLQFLFVSARSIDQNFLTTEGWFIPFQHMVQFIVPDFFGNPTTLNYWGTWNYGELVGYIGVAPVLLVMFAFFKKNITVLFFASVAAISLVFALPTGIASLPFMLEVPFISSAQPTRLLFPITFSLSVLAAFGASYIFTLKKFHTKLLIPPMILIVLFSICWSILLFGSSLFPNPSDLLIAQRNTIFPSAIGMLAILLVGTLFFVRKNVYKDLIITVILLVTFLELLRFAQKYTPFVSREYLYPLTETLSYLKGDPEVFRVAVLDRRIMPPNFFTHYKIQTIEGYDPLYLTSYAEYIVALERNGPEVSHPYGFNRIITPHNVDSPLFNFLNTKYVLSIDEVGSEHFVKVMEEGVTKLYLNKRAFPRVFFVENVVESRTALAPLFQNDLNKTAIIGENYYNVQSLHVGKAAISEYANNYVVIKTENPGNGFLVMSDAYYPTWRVYIDGVESELVKTNHAFRGVFVPKGSHTIEFRNEIF